MIDNKFKFPGWILVITGVIVAFFYFTFDLRFKIPVLAVISSYAETRFFAFFKTNFADELIFILLLAGFSMIVFSKEKIENADVTRLRKEALQKAVVADIVIILFAVLFFYGSVFLSIIVLNTILPFILYLVIFYSSLYRIKPR